VIAAVLAGGQSRRMGRAKAVVELAGLPLIAHAIAAAAAAGLEPVVVAKPGSELPPLDVPVWEEAAETSHPLAGLVCALERAGGPVVVLTCDMPFVTPGLLSRLAAAPGTATAGQPFPGRYEPSALPVLRAALERETSVKAALAELSPAVLAAEADELDGVNTPEELAAASLRLMPSAEEWIEAFATALGRPAPTEAERQSMLKLASVAAHASERRAAPIACWLAAAAGMDLDEAIELAQRL
jgi:molybdenum cofactor guanylyltransferase